MRGGAGVPDSPTDGTYVLARDVLELNCGGFCFTIKRSTLCQVEGSMLSALFSGRWSHERDEAGRLFLDWHPKLGAKLVDWLRERRMIEDGEAMPPPDIPAELARTWARFVRYIGLAEAMYTAESGVQLGFVRVCVPTHQPKKSEVSMGIVWEQRPCVTTEGFPSLVTDSRANVFGFCHPPLRSRSAAWRVRVVSKSGSAAITFGLASQPLISTNSRGIITTAIYARGDSCTYTKEDHMYDPGWPALRSGDEVVLRLDSERALLHFWHERPQVYDAVELTKGVRTWFPFVSYTPSQAIIELKPASIDDVLNCMR